MKKFIVAIDGSEYSLRALKCAIELSQSLDAEIVLINVQPSFSTANVKRFFSEEEIKNYQQELGKEAFKSAEELLQSTNCKFSTVIRTGTPAVEICNFAKEVGAAGIFMGSRGFGPIRGAILGSVSYSVLNNAPCPVTIV